MIIRLKPRMRMTSRAVDALEEATKMSIVRDYKNGKDIFWLNGYRFNSLPNAGRFLLAQINGWMLVNELVNLEIIKEARMANCGQGTFTFFEIVED